LKFIILLLSIGLLSFGWAGNIKLVAIAGAIIYLSAYVIDIIKFLTSKPHHKGDTTAEATENGHDKDILQIFEKVLEALILFTGLGTFLYGVEGEFKEIWALPGAIIWCGTLLLYLIDGIIFRETTGIPIRMGYGGWYIPRSRRRPRSGYYKRRTTRSRKV